MDIHVTRQITQIIIKLILIIQERGLEPVAPCHRLGLNTMLQVILTAAVGIKRLDLLHHIVYKVRHLLNGTVLIVMHLGNRHRTLLGMSECLKVHHVIVQAENITPAVELYYAGMVAACTDGVVHDMALVLPRTLRTVAHGITYSLRTTC